MYMHKRLYTLFSIITTASQAMTSEQLARLVSVTSRTVKNDLRALNEMLADKGVKILAKQGLGYTIEYEDSEVYKTLLKELNQTQVAKHQNIPCNSHERVDYIIKKLLTVDFPIKVDDFLEEMYVSRSTITIDLKEVKSILSSYHLCLSTKSHAGMIIEGQEIFKRLCIAEYFFHNQYQEYFYAKDNAMFNSVKSKKEIELIKMIMIKAMNLHMINLSDLSIENLTIHIIVMLRRVTFYNYAEIDHQHIEINTIYYQCAYDMIKNIEVKFDILLPVDEIIYLAMHLKSKHIDEIDKEQMKINSQLNELLDQLFIEIKMEYNINLMEDEELRNFLLLHIPPMLERLKMNLVMRNPLAIENSTRYFYSSQISAFACDFLSKQYGIAIDTNEFGYLILYFNLALMRIENAQKYKIALICGRGRPETITILNELRENFGSMMQSIQILDTHQLEQEVLNDLQLIITTIPLTKQLQIPVVKLKENNEDNRYQILQAMNQLRYPQVDLKKYMNQNYIFTHIKGNNKLEVLNDYMKALREMNESYEFLKLLDNENASTFIELKNHGVCVRSINNQKEDSRIHVVVLNKPVVFHKSLVQVIVSVQCNNHDMNDLIVICKCFSLWFQNEEMIQRFLKTPSLQLLLIDFQQVSILSNR